MYSNLKVYVFIAIIKAVYVSGSMSPPLILVLRLSLIFVVSLPCFRCGFVVRSSSPLPTIPPSQFLLTSFWIFSYFRFTKYLNLNIGSEVAAAALRLLLLVVSGHRFVVFCVCSFNYFLFLACT